MAQSWTADTYAAGHVAATDLGNIETNFATLKSLFSGSSAPSNTVAGMPWFDTNKKLLKIRNNADSAWLGVLYGPSSLKVWVYANSANDGWAIDSGVTDVVLSLKGGSQAYNVAAAQTAGTWTQPDNAWSHSHTVDGHTHSTPNHKHHVPIYEVGGEIYFYPAYGSGSDSAGANNWNKITVDSTYSTSSFNTAKTSGENGGNTGSASPGTDSQSAPDSSAWRPAAAVGTLQYPDV
jgi:hypothetical protein